MTRKRRRRADAVESRIEEMIYAELRRLGWLVPETEADVEGSEQAMEEMLPLPKRLSDPYDLLDRSPSDPPAPSTGAHAEDRAIEEELARAAREGRGTISEEVEERMKQDRRRAEELAKQVTKEYDD